MNKGILFGASVLIAAAASAAVPKIVPGSVTYAQSSVSSAEITYTLAGAPAIVTVDVQTNRTGRGTSDEADWVSIGEVNLTNAVGDVNRLVQPGSRTISWNPSETLPPLCTKCDAARAVVKAWPEFDPPDYFVAQLKSPYEHRFYASADAIPRGGIASDENKQDYMIMRRIRAKGVEWLMGSAEGAYNHAANQKQHRVMLTNDYYLAIYPLTRGQLNIFAPGQKIADYQYKYVLPESYSTFWNNNDYGRPETNHYASCAAHIGNGNHVRGNAADGGSNWPTDRHAVYSKSLVGQMRAKTGIDFDLPTEAQWEYAARAGTTTVTYNGDFDALTHATVLPPIAWFNSNRPRINPDDPASSKTVWQVVGQLQPNAFGLYDMIGLCKEICLDWYAADYGGSEDGVLYYEPEGPTSGDYRVNRAMGSDWDYPAFTVAQRQRSGTDQQNRNGVRFMCPLSLVFPADQK